MGHSFSKKRVKVRGTGKRPLKMERDREKII